MWKPISLFNETEVLKAYVKSKKKTPYLPSDINSWFSKIESMDKRVDLNHWKIKYALSLGVDFDL